MESRYDKEMLALRRREVAALERQNALSLCKTGNHSWSKAGKAIGINRDSLKKYTCTICRRTRYELSK